MSPKPLLVETSGEVLWVTLNRPERLNALNDDLVSQLRALFESLYRRRDIRVVVIRGVGRAFCSGLDLKEGTDFDGRSVGDLLDSQRNIAEIVIAMRRCPQPVIALVQGAASGGGFALALGADVRLATTDAVFNAAFIRLGLSACDIGVSYFLPRMIGSSIAAELLLTGDFIAADRAYQLGLVSRVMDAGDLEAEARSIVDSMLTATPVGLRLTKEALNLSVDAQGLEAVIAMEDRNQVLCVKDNNFDEGITAFREKRKPVYRHQTKTKSTNRQEAGADMSAERKS